MSELFRIGRDSVRTPAAILAVEESGVEIHSYLSRSRITLSNEAGEMSTTLQSLLASFERRRTSDRTHDALRRRAAAGAATGGAPFGYAIERNGSGYAHYVIDSVEAQTVREVFVWFDDKGLGLIAIAKAVERAQHPSSARRTLEYGTVRLLLRRGIYTGIQTLGHAEEHDEGGHARPAAGSSRG